MNTMHIVSDTTPRVRFYGRTATVENGVLIPWSAGGFSVRFRGTALVATLATNNPQNPNARPYVKVFTDGVQTADIGLCEAAADVVLAEGLTAGEHTVTVLKRSEALQSDMTLTALSTDGEWLDAPTCDTARRIQFIGDSITTGFGVMASPEQTDFTTAEQDALTAYAMQVADALHAEAHVFAISGYAIHRSPYGQPIPPLYRFADGAAGCKYPWDFDRFQPDLTVINLGTNDHAWFCNECAAHLTEEERHRQIEEAYYRFLKELQGIHPHSRFLCVIGMMYAFVIEDVERAAARAAADGMDVRFQRLPLAGEWRIGHPAPSTHKIAADILTPLIADWMGWE